MRFGQPDVQRQEASLGTKAEQGEQKGERWPDALCREIAHGIEGIVAGAAGHDAKRKQNANRTNVCDQQVEVAGAPDFGLAVFRGNQEEGTECHGFPGDHEGIAVIGQHDESHAGDKQVIDQAVQTRG